MPRVTRQQMHREWNALIRQARERGIRLPNGIGEWMHPPQTLAYGTERLAMIRTLLGNTAATPPATPATGAPLGDLTAFPDFTFGIEMECFLTGGVTKQQLAAAITEAGVPCRTVEYYGGAHATISQWKLVTDGSLQDYVNGIEVVSPVLRGEAGIEQLAKVCGVLKAKNCKVKRSCGFHVHVGVGSTPGAGQEPVALFKNLAALYAKYQDVIDTFMAPSRKENPYCRPLRYTQAAERAETVDGVVRGVGQQPGVHNVRSSGRYAKLNFQSYWQHGTVEFRHHQGTIEADKACNWARLCMRMVELAKHSRADTHEQNLDGLMNAINASEPEKAFFAARQALFQRRAERRANA